MENVFNKILSRAATYLGFEQVPTSIEPLIAPKSSIENYLVDIFLGHGGGFINPCEKCGCDCCRVVTGQDPRYEGHCEEWRDSERWMAEMCAELDTAQAREGAVYLKSVE